VILATIGGGTAVAYANLKTRADQLQAALTAYLQAGQRELEAGKASLTEANSKHDTTLVTQATAHFAAAKTQFQAAANLADNSRLLQYMEQIPAVGGSVHSKHAAVSGVAQMGVALSDAGRELSSLDGQLIKPPGIGQATHTLLTTLDQTQASLVNVRLDLDRAQRAAGHVDVQVLPAGQQATFLKARNAIAAAQSGLDEFGRLVPVLKEVLGANGVRHYLVEQVNPAELRAGGGFIGSYSLLKTDQGKLTLEKSGDSYELSEPRPKPGQATFIPLPDAYREVIPQVSWSFVDSDVFPDFSSNAKQAETFVEPRLGIKIDGVIAIDYYAVAKMLELTGPLNVPGYAITVDAANFVSFLVRHDIAQDAIHKAVLTAIAGPLMERISALPPDRWPALIQALNDAATGRHLQVYFNSDLVQQEMDRFGWSGAVNPTGSRDYMMEVESNYGGSKSNCCLTRQFTLALTRKGNMLHHRLQINLVNNLTYNVPVLPGQIVHYRAYFRLYVGATATSASHNLRPPKYPEFAPPAGTLLLDGWLTTIECCGGKGEAVIDYDTPWPVRDTGRSQIYWQKQPGVVNDKVDVIWSDGSGHTYTVSGDLNQDRVITLTPTGVILTAGQPAQAKLPSLSLG
jgi:hypothetical protein